MADPISFSPGTDRFLNTIRPYHKKSGRAAFPTRLPDDLDLRLGSDESNHEWFRRICDGIGTSAPESIQIEENIAMTADLRWNEDRKLYYVNIQVIVSTNSLVDYYFNSDFETFYLRMDYDEMTLGRPFTHSLPHIHCSGSMSPRFALEGETSETIVVDFLDFLYRHYIPDAWRSWAERVWYASPGSAPRNDHNDWLPRIFEAFANSQLPVLRERARDLTRFKAALARAKESYLDLRVSREDRELLEYATR